MCPLLLSLSSASTRTIPKLQLLLFCFITLKHFALRKALNYKVVLASLSHHAFLILDMCISSALFPSTMPPPSSTRTAALCFSLLCEPDSAVLSLHVPVEQGFLGLQAAGQGHEDRVDVLRLPWVLRRRLKQQHVVGVSKLQRHVGGHLGQ